MHGGCSEKMAIYEPGSELSPDNKSVENQPWSWTSQPLDLWEEMFVVYKPPSLWYFCYSSPNGPRSSTDSLWRLQECRLGDPPPSSCPIWKTCRLFLGTVEFILESILLSQAGVCSARKREWPSQELPSSLRDGNCERNTAASPSLPVVIRRCVHGSSRGFSGRWAQMLMVVTYSLEYLFCFSAFYSLCFLRSLPPQIHYLDSHLCLRIWFWRSKLPDSFPDIPSASNGTSLVLQWLSSALPMQGHGFESLAGQLRSHMTRCYLYLQQTKTKTNTPNGSNVFPFLGHMPLFLSHCKNHILSYLKEIISMTYLPY